MNMLDAYYYIGNYTINYSFILTMVMLMIIITILNVEMNWDFILVVRLQIMIFNLQIT